jgi:thiamine pyrophosphate-dependent acetolactate synthase large subunit-like protein
VKWDDEPASLSAFAESAVRAYKIAMTPPAEPVLLVVDHDMQLKAMPQAKGWSRPLLKFSGGSGDILRDVLH